MKIQELKQYQITDYLQGLGFEPVKSVGNSLVYYSPKRTEKTPSFYVTPSRNVWTDYGNGSRGDIIDLIKYLYDFDCTTACKHLENIVNGLAYSLPKNSFSSFGNEVSSHKNTIIIKTVKPLQANSLIAYCESRKIPFHLAYKYLNEVHYTNNGKSYYSLGLKNDEGGFELRSKQFQGGNSPKTITTINVPESKNICVFESFFDFLSALVFYETDRPKCTTIILNSTNNLTKAFPQLATAKVIYSFMDLDDNQTGQKTTQKMRDEGLNVLDQSKIYKGCKDFNEFLIKNYISK